MPLNEAKLREAREILKSNSKQLDKIIIQYCPSASIRGSDSLGDSHEVFSVNFIKNRVPTAERMTPTLGIHRISADAGK